MRASLLIMLSLTVLGGCSSSSAFRYHTEPTPLEPGVSQYRLQSVEINLDDGPEGAPLSRYASESELQALFRKQLREQLAMQQVLAREDEEGESIYDLAVTIDYNRRFKWLIGWSLMKPAANHELLVSRDGKKLASHRLGGYTTDHGLVGNTLRQVRILFFLTGPEDERRDVRALSEALADRVAEFGKRDTDS